MAKIGNKVLDLRDALIDLKAEAGWTAHHLNDPALLVDAVESGEMALKVKGVVEAAAALRKALDEARGDTPIGTSAFPARRA